MPSETYDLSNVCNIRAPGEGQRMVHVTLEEDVFTRALAILAKHPDWDLDRLVNVGLESKVGYMEIDDKYPLPEPTPPRSENIERTSIEGHVTTSHQLLRRAQSELNRRWRRRASKTVWDGIAHALGAIAVKRGWDHRCSADISEQMVLELGREHFYTWIAVVEGVRDHEDYWGEVRRADNIQYAIDQATAFVEELDEVREMEPRPFTIRDQYDQQRLARLLGISRDRRDQELLIGTVDPNGFSRNSPDDTGIEG